jgi:hypothetical protein
MFFQNKPTQRLVAPRIEAQPLNEVLLQEVPVI